MGIRMPQMMPNRANTTNTALSGTQWFDSYFINKWTDTTYNVTQAMDSMAFVMTYDPRNREMPDEKAEGLVLAEDVVKSDTMVFLAEASADGFTGSVEYARRGDKLRATLYDANGESVGTYIVDIVVTPEDGSGANQWMEKRSTWLRNMGGLGA
jgi:hypothetical protein